MKYSVQAFNAGTFWVPGPEVYWMEAWNQREEMNILIYLIRGGGHNILINTGPPQDLGTINKAWLDFFGYPEAQIVRSEAQLLQNILKSQGLTPDDISTVLVTPLQTVHFHEPALFLRERRSAVVGLLAVVNEPTTRTLLLRTPETIRNGSRLICTRTTGLKARC